MKSGTLDRVVSGEKFMLTGRLSKLLLLVVTLLRVACSRFHCHFSITNRINLVKIFQSCLIAQAARIHASWPQHAIENVSRRTIYAQHRHDSKDNHHSRWPGTHRCPENRHRYDKNTSCCGGKTRCRWYWAQIHAGAWRNYQARSKAGDVENHSNREIRLI
ncbi:hypothetical protein DFJ77DRAFT_171283 [Powellomyces hirtus]|nr:hypothetical protein DFJ77DRAFT_171283 [Powellomyces hirtus]